MLLRAGAVLLFASALGAQPAPLPSLREQAVVRPAWLESRLNNVLPALMQRHGVRLNPQTHFHLVGASRAAARQTDEWQPLFDGRSLRNWTETPFTGRGPVRVENDAIVLGAGEPMTGVHLTTPFPKSDYEVRFEAARLRGSDFFASLTFPVQDSFCTFVTGGWGGDIVGLSNLDGWDASDNETRTYVEFESGRWYKFRVQVTGSHIKAWIDEQPTVNVAITGRTISLRPGEIKLSAPFGFAAYRTTGALRKIEYRRLRTS